MLRVICEGSENKAEYQFVKIYIETYFFNYDYIIIAAGGNTNLVSELERLESQVNKDDTVILFFDSIEEIGNLSVVDIINRFKNSFESKSVQFIFSTYYCFEELFLSYLDYGQIIKSSNYNSLKTQIDQIQSLLYNHKNYYRTLFRDSNFNSFWSRLINGFNNLSTREQCSSAICKYLYSNTTGHFKVTKDSLGECWLNSCDHINDIHKKVCEECNYTCKNCNSINKMEHIKARTVLSFDK